MFFIVEDQRTPLIKQKYVQHATSPTKTKQQIIKNNKTKIKKTKQATT